MWGSRRRYLGTIFGMYAAEVRVTSSVTSAIMHHNHNRRSTLASRDPLYGSLRNASCDEENYRTASAAAQLGASPVRQKQDAMDFQ